MIKTRVENTWVWESSVNNSTILSVLMYTASEHKLSNDEFTNKYKIISPR